MLRCRELAAFVEASLPMLPAREETPFLYGQLDDILQRLQAGLRQIATAEQGASDKGGFLRRLAGKKAPREQPRRSEPRYDLQGNAWTIPVTELVGFLSHSGKSGLLWVTSPCETFVLEFSRGHLVHATSNAPPVAFRLGEILLEEGMLSATELAEVIDYAKAADDLLGSYLVRTGRLQHADLQRALAIQVQQLFHRLMDAENALYRFQESAQLLRSQSLEVNITQLLLESARKKDEERLSAERSAAGESEKRGCDDDALSVLVEEPKAEVLAAKGAAAKPSESKPAESKGSGSKDKDSKGSEAKLADTDVIDTRATETKTAEAKPAESKSAPAKGAESKSTESKSPDSKSTESKGAGEPSAPLPHAEAEKKQEPDSKPAASPSSTTTKA